MPIETQDAVKWALTQTYTDNVGDTYQITKTTAQPLVDAVRSYFDAHQIVYSTFSYADLEPYLL